MQLFLTEYKKNGTTIVVSDADLLSQLRKVLRTSIGDIVRIQSPQAENKKIRYEVRIDVRDSKMFEGTIISEQVWTTSQEQRSMIIAMPNKWDKVELIVQKLTECGLDQIIFWPSERSILKERNPKKEERLYKIIKEAVEQSRGRKVPKLHFAPDIKEYLQDAEVTVFDKECHLEGNERYKGLLDSSLRSEGQKHICGLVGPEGGFTKRDYQIFEAYAPKIVSLGETVLRMETAAIVGGRFIKNDFSGKILF